MAFKRMVPSTAQELKEYLVKIHENRDHLASAKVNEANAHIEIDLDRKANFFGYSDMYIPVKRAKLAAAKELVDRLLTQSSAGFAPSDSDAQTLFEMIDQHAG